MNVDGWGGALMQSVLVYDPLGLEWQWQTKCVDTILITQSCSCNPGDLDSSHACLHAHAHMYVQNTNTNKPTLSKEKKILLHKLKLMEQKILKKETWSGVVFCK